MNVSKHFMQQVLQNEIILIANKGLRKHNAIRERLF